MKETQFIIHISGINVFSMFGMVGKSRLPFWLSFRKLVCVCVLKTAEVRGCILAKASISICVISWGTVYNKDVTQRRMKGPKEGGSLVFFFLSWQHIHPACHSFSPFRVCRLTVQSGPFSTWMGSTDYIGFDVMVWVQEWEDKECLWSEKPLSVYFNHVYLFPDFFLWSIFSFSL